MNDNKIKNKFVWTSFYTGNPPFKNISQFFAIETVVLQSKSFNFCEYDTVLL